MSIVDVKHIIAQSLHSRGIDDVGAAAAVVEALRAKGVHLVTTPTFTTNPTEGTAEFEAVMDRLDRYSANPRTITRVLATTVDDEVLTATMVVSPFEAAEYRTNDSLREHTRRKMGIDLLAAMWRRFDPKSAVSV